MSSSHVILNLSKVSACYDLVLRISPRELFEFFTRHIITRASLSSVHLVSYMRYVHQYKLEMNVSQVAGWLVFTTNTGVCAGEFYKKVGGGERGGVTWTSKRHLAICSAAS